MHNMQTGPGCKNACLTLDAPELLPKVFSTGQRAAGRRAERATFSCFAGYLTP